MLTGSVILAKLEVSHYQTRAAVEGGTNRADDAG